MTRSAGGNSNLKQKGTDPDPVSSRCTAAKGLEAAVGTCLPSQPAAGTARPNTHCQASSSAAQRTSCAASQFPWLAQAEMAAFTTSTVRHSGRSQARQNTASASGSRPLAA